MHIVSDCALENCGIPVDVANTLSELPQMNEAAVLLANHDFSLLRIVESFN